jgi:hypothetical protein
MFPAPKTPAAFPDLRAVKPKTRFGGGLRRRWKNAGGNIFEWDHQHGAVEMYDARGRHLGQFDAATGERQSGPERGRTIKP